MTDVLIVGSGAGAVNAAAPLVERGLEVAMIDVGNVDAHYAPLVPDAPWSEIRRTCEDQHRFFLGDDFEGIPIGEVRVGAQLTPPRMFISEDTERLLPVDSSNFDVTLSLAAGGLAAGWGAGAFTFDDDDLPGTPFTAAALGEHYDAVADRIGVSGASDDLSAFLPDPSPLLPALEIDPGARRVQERYTRRRDQFRRDGFHLGVTRIAACSQAHRGRGPHHYHDMEYWADHDRSVYRPRWTLDELRRATTFQYLDRRYVRSFRDTDDGVEVTFRNVATETEDRLRARALVLGAGAVGSARIALRSLDAFGTAVPILCNPYTYAPVLNLGMLGRATQDRRHGLAQLTAIFAPNDAAPVVAQYYSYRSLLTYKLVKESPLARRESIGIMRRLLPMLGVLGIHHPDRPTPTKTAILRRGDSGAPDRLEIDYRPGVDETTQNNAAERGLLRQFRRLGCRTLKRVRPGHGAAIHYAGTLPFDTQDRDLTCDEHGRLRGTRAVYVADGSVFPALPAKGLTLTIMAHANRVGTHLADALT